MRELRTSADDGMSAQASVRREGRRPLVAHDAEAQREHAAGAPRSGC
jgi:hypothetical protein